MIRTIDVDQVVDAGESWRWLGALVISASYGVELVVVKQAFATGELPSVNGRAHESDVQAWREDLDVARIERRAHARRLQLIKRRAEVRVNKVRR